MNNLDISEIDIHPQHTKHMLCKIIQNSNMDIFQPYLLCKEKVLSQLSGYLINSNHELQFFDTTFPFNNKKEFILYLGKSPNLLTSGEKRMISDKAKTVIQFCKSGYDFNKSKFQSMDEVYTQCLKIQEYGDIFCVRTAISLFNLTLDPDKQIPCNMSSIIHNKLQIKNAYKKNCTPSLQVKHGKFLVIFD
tara:strand:- start:11561 stop:12133 length:573 start_codon:yes stop_codon:yes gene_type:complete